jgi:hypothetical protein
MHLGNFPNGFEFATFVMARNNYPFEKMGVPDHDTMMKAQHARVPSRTELTGSWNGTLVFLRRPDLALHNQFNPRLFRFDFAADGCTARVRSGPFTSDKRVSFESDCVRLTDTSSRCDEIRLVDSDTLVGRRFPTAAADGTPTFRYVLTRAAR